MSHLFHSFGNKIVAVTGSTGYIGSSLIKKLEECSTKKIIRISRKKKDSHVSNYKNVDWVLDMNKVSSWKKIISEADIVFHLAGNTSVYAAEENPEESLASTLLPIIALVKASQELKKVPRVIFASTATLYGLTNTFPVKETIRPSPITMYDLHKSFAEQKLDMASRNQIIEAISLRLANVYGPSLNESNSDDRGVLSKLIRMKFEGKDLKIFGSGNYLRDYIYIDDVVNAFLHAGIMNFENSTFNVASGTGISLKEVFNLISLKVEEITGVYGKIENAKWPEGFHQIEKRSFVASIELLKSYSDWSPIVTLDEGIQHLIEYYRKYYNYD
jgi:UDP-glucose 4-epimerase